MPDTAAQEARLVLDADPGHQGHRLDLVLHAHLPELSRSALARLIRQGHVLVDGVPAAKPGQRLRGQERIVLRHCPPSSPDIRQPIGPVPVDFKILFEDEHILVLDKPPGLVVHPGSGDTGPTLAHGLLHHCGPLPGLEENRPGIVHRLDKDTSGLMVAARTRKALRALSAAFKDREVRKTYLGLTARPPREPRGRVLAPIGRHPVRRQKMAVRERDGRFAATAWQVLEAFPAGPCLVELRPETGRTHQIRVHLAHLGCPLLGDPLYGGPRSLPGGGELARHCLHAHALAFSHPASGRPLRFTSPLWPDMAALVETLRQNDPGGLPR